MKHRYRIGIDGSGIDEFIKGIDEYKDWLERGIKRLVQKLTEEGYDIASAGFQGAQYDGINDSGVFVEDRGETAKAVVAVGGAVLFIEFGTGVTYPDDHPEAAANGMIRGGYGLGNGKRNSWTYYGEPGTNGQIVKVGPKGQKVVTRGNPANKPMYEAVKQLKERLPQAVKEAFGND